MRPWFACNGFAVQATYPRPDEDQSLHGEWPDREAKRGIEAASLNLQRCRRAGLTPDEEA